LKEKNEFANIFDFFELMKENLVKILEPGVGWKENMAAHNRQRKNTSKHAQGIWEEFSFLNKGETF